MLSIKKLGRGSERYYLGLVVEDYYLEGGEPPGYFLGNRSGPVTHRALRSLLQGFDPETGSPLVQNAGRPNRASGWDVTFSPPGSVSVAWAQAPLALREQLEAAHAESVAHALGALEAIAGRSRMGKGGRLSVPARLIVGVFEHGSARAVDSNLPDPQLHTHCVIPNVGFRRDGSTGALVSHGFYEYQLQLTSIYRYELARRLRALGFEITPLGKKLGFRLDCIPKELEQHFSKRRAQITRSLEEHGTSGARASEAAALSTRQRKGRTPPRADLFAAWQAEARALGHTIEWPGTAAPAEPSRRPRSTPNQRRFAAAVIEREAELLSQYKGRFDRDELLCRTLDKTVGNRMPSLEVAKILERYLAGNKLVTLENERGKTFYRTRQAARARSHLKQLIERERRSTSRRATAVSAATPGPAHLGALSRDLRRQGNHVVVLSRSRRAAEALDRDTRLSWEDGTRRKGTGVEATTLARFLWNVERGDFHVGPLPPAWLRETARALGAITERARRYLAWSSARRPLQIDRRSVVLVDAAHLLTAAELSALLESTKRHGARLVFFGAERGAYGDYVLGRLSHESSRSNKHRTRNEAPELEVSR